MTEYDLRTLDMGIAAAVSTFVEALGMHAENQNELKKGNFVRYNEKHFKDLIERNGCDWDSVISRWQR